MEKLIEENNWRKCWGNIERKIDSINYGKYFKDTFGGYNETNNWKKLLGANIGGNIGRKHWEDLLEENLGI